MKLTCCTVIEVCNLIAKTYLHFHDGQCGGCLAIFSFSLVAPLWHERKINVCNMNTQITGAELSCLCACICERIFQCTRVQQAKLLSAASRYRQQGGLTKWLLLNLCLHFRGLIHTGGVIYAPSFIASVSVFPEVCLHLLLQCCNVTDSHCECACC